MPEPALLDVAASVVSYGPVDLGALGVDREGTLGRIETLLDAGNVWDLTVPPRLTFDQQGFVGAAVTNPDLFLDLPYSFEGLPPMVSWPVGEAGFAHWQEEWDNYPGAPSEAHALRWAFNPSNYLYSFACASGSVELSSFFEDGVEVGAMCTLPLFTLEWVVDGTSTLFNVAPLVLRIVNAGEGVPNLNVPYIAAYAVDCATGEIPAQFVPADGSEWGFPLYDQFQSEEPPPQEAVDLVASFVGPEPFRWLTMFWWERADWEAGRPDTLNFQLTLGGLDGGVPTAATYRWVFSDFADHLGPGPYPASGQISEPLFAQVTESVASLSLLVGNENVPGSVNIGSGAVESIGSGGPYVTPVPPDDDADADGSLCDLKLEDGPLLRTVGPRFLRGEQVGCS